MYEHPTHLTRFDLQALEARLLKRLEAIELALTRKLDHRQATYTIQQFAEATGLTYHCVLAKCRRGKLNARQDGPGARWTINGSELDRYLSEATENRW